MRAILVFAALVCRTLICNGVGGLLFGPPSGFMDAQQNYYEVMTHCEREGGECIDVDFGGPNPPDTTDPPPTAPPPTFPITRPTTSAPTQPPYNIPVFEPFVPYVPPLPAQRPTTLAPSVPWPRTQYWQLPYQQPTNRAPLPYHQPNYRAPAPRAQFRLKPNPQPFLSQRRATPAPQPRLQNWLKPNPQPYFPPPNPRILPPQRPTPLAPPTWPRVPYMVSQNVAGPPASPTLAPRPTTRRPQSSTSAPKRQRTKGQKTIRIIHVEKELPETRKRRAVGLNEPLNYLYSECRGGWEFDLGCGNRGGNVCCYPASARRR